MGTDRHTSLSACLSVCVRVSILTSTKQIFLLESQPEVCDPTLQYVVVDVGKIGPIFYPPMICISEYFLLLVTHTRTTQMWRSKTKEMLVYFHRKWWIVHLHMNHLFIEGRMRRIRKGSYILHAENITKR